MIPMIVFIELQFFENTPKGPKKVQGINKHRGCTSSSSVGGNTILSKISTQSTMITEQNFEDSDEYEELQDDAKENDLFIDCQPQEIENYQAQFKKMIALLDPNKELFDYLYDSILIVERDENDDLSIGTYSIVSINMDDFLDLQNEALINKIELTPKFEQNQKREIECKNEIKKENIKTEFNLKEENKTRFTYIIDDNDEEVQFVGVKKKLKFEEENDLRGTIVEGIKDFKKINSNDDGDVIEIKDFKQFVPKEKIQHTGSKKKELFVCAQGATINHNEHLTEPLERIMKAYESYKEVGRRQICLLNQILSHGYRRLISILKSLPKKIEKAEDLKGTFGIGDKFLSKIKEILETGTSKKAEFLENNETAKVISLFDSVWGIGVSTATKFYQRGFRTLDDLRRNQHLLTGWQKIGLKYHEEFQIRIPREDIDQIIQMINQKVTTLTNPQHLYEVVCCGSYRRGKASCGDIDILITRKDGDYDPNLLTVLVKSLEGVLLTEHINMPRMGEHFSQTYMGVCVFKEVHRRIDFKVYPRDQWGCALLYFTGSDNFNRSMRLLATKRGLNLNDHGVQALIHGKGNDRVLGSSIPCYSEEDVFKLLGLEYKPPHERNL